MTFNMRQEVLANITKRATRQRALRLAKRLLATTPAIAKHLLVLRVGTCDLNATVTHDTAEEGRWLHSVLGERLLSGMAGRRTGAIKDETACTVVNNGKAAKCQGSLIGLP